MLCVFSWCGRFINRCRQKKETQEPAKLHLTSKEVAQTRLLLLRLSQQQSFHATHQLLSSGKTLPKSDSLSRFCPYLDEDQLMRVGGRLEKTDLPHSTKHPVILHHSSHIVKLLCLQVHKTSGHPGPGALQAILAQDFLITGARRLAKETSKHCVPCQKAYARTKNQLMGKLPPDRATPSPPFSVTGLDFAGPFTTLRGNQRKPTQVKRYICLFVCFSTKAVHLELCSDLSAETFIDALRRFTARRGLPSHIYCDNGRNFVGAAKELTEVAHLMQSLIYKLKLPR